MPNALTLIRTSSSEGTGSGSSLIERTSGPPNSVMTIAFISHFLSAGRCPTVVEQLFKNSAQRERPAGRRWAQPPGALAQVGESGVHDRLEHLPSRVGLAHNHQPHSGGHQL